MIRWGHLAKRNGHYNNEPNGDSRAEKHNTWKKKSLDRLNNNWAPQKKRSGSMKTIQSEKEKKKDKSKQNKTKQQQ